MELLATVMHSPRHSSECFHIATRWILSTVHQFTVLPVQPEQASSFWCSSDGTQKSWEGKKKRVSIEIWKKIEDCSCNPLGGWWSTTLTGSLHSVSRTIYIWHILRISHRSNYLLQRPDDIGYELLLDISLSKMSYDLEFEGIPPTHESNSFP